MKPALTHPTLRGGASKGGREGESELGRVRSEAAPALLTALPSGRPATTTTALQRLSCWTNTHSAVIITNSYQDLLAVMEDGTKLIDF